MFSHVIETTPQRVDARSTNESHITKGSANVAIPIAAQSTIGRTLCKYYPTGSCKYGDSCRNLHTVPESYESPPCKFFVSGRCKLGDTCRFRHGDGSAAGGVVQKMNTVGSTL